MTTVPLRARLAALRERRLVRWAMDGALLAIVLVAVSAWQTRNHLRGLAPDFSLPTLAGGEVTRASLAGKPALLVFWAPWCGVCRANEGAVATLEGWVGERAHVVSVASDYQDVEEIRQYVQRHDVAGTVLLGGTATARSFEVRAFPTFYFLDEAGRIQGSAMGYTTAAGLWARLSPLP